MLIELLRNEIKSVTRGKFWQQGIAIKILLIFFAIYFLLSALGLGFAIEDILKESYPDIEVVATVNQFLLYYFVIDLVMRIFLQSFPLMSIQPYLTMPIPKSTIFHFLLIRSIPNFFNILPLFFAVPFMIRSIAFREGIGTGLVWLTTFFFLTLMNHFIAFYIKRTLSVKPIFLFGMILGLVGLYYVDQMEVVPFKTYFGQWIDATMAQPVLILVPVLLAAASYFLLFTRMKKYAYLDAFSKRKKQQSTQQFEILDRFGRFGELMQLDLKLIWRNKRPKTMVMMSFFFVLYPLIFDDLLDTNWFLIFIGVFTVGMLMANYGQFMVSWESSFFDFLMTQNYSMRDYYESKYYLFTVANLTMLYLRFSN
ncbi:MAG: DUF5687 family protein [Bacteroidota bacterium]